MVCSDSPGGEGPPRKNAYNQIEERGTEKVQTKTPQGGGGNRPARDTTKKPSKTPTVLRTRY